MSNYHVKISFPIPLNSVGGQKSKIIRPESHPDQNKITNSITFILTLIVTPFICYPRKQL